MTGREASQPNVPQPEPVPVGEGFRIDSPTSEELAEVLRAAVDYRGDVTLILRGGEELRGYIFDFDSTSPERSISLFPEHEDAKRRLLCAEIEGVSFSGKDTASGRSWETWVQQYNEKKAARARGEDVGPIGIDPEPLS